MILFLVLALSLVIALVRGGKLDYLAQLNFRWTGLILAGFLIQVLIFSDFWQGNSDTSPLTPFVYLLSLVILLVALGINFRLPGLPLMTLGFGCNFLAIAANGGYMPSLNSAREVAGRVTLAAGQIVSNSIGVGPETRLVFLGDILAIPHDFIFPNVFSIGDALIAAGAFILIQKVMVKPALEPRSE